MIMDQVILGQLSQKGLESRQSKNRTDKLDLFLNLLKENGDKAAMHNGQQLNFEFSNEKVTRVELNYLNFSSSFVADTQSYTKTSVDSEMRDQLSKSELYDQKWYSIGKLSYIDSDRLAEHQEFIRSTGGVESSLNRTFSLEKNPSKIGVESRVNAVGVGVLDRKHQSEGLRQRSVVELSKLITQVHDVREIEKQKLTLFHNGNSKTVVVRDYFSSSNDMLSQLKHFIQNAKGKIMKLIFNGKVVK